jgi:hypothetical protein
LQRPGHNQLATRTQHKMMEIISTSPSTTNCSEDIEICYQDDTTLIEESSTCTVSLHHDDDDDEFTRESVTMVEKKKDDTDTTTAAAAAAATTTTKATVPSFTGYRLHIALGCGSFILLIGIVALLLGLKGYFTFTEPCVGVRPFSLEDLDLGSILGEEATNNQSQASMLFQIVSMLSGKNSSESTLPSPLNAKLELMMLIENTNPYDVSYKQNKKGTITIPVSSMSLTSQSDDTELSFPPEHEDDLNIGTWGIPDSILKKRALNEIPLTVKATIDLENRGDGLGLVDLFMSGSGLMLRVEGEIEGSSWIPGLNGQTTLLCVAQVNLGHEAKIKCKKSTTIGRLINKQEEFSSGGTANDMETKLGSTCFL